MLNVLVFSVLLIIGICCRESKRSGSPRPSIAFTSCTFGTMQESVSVGRASARLIQFQFRGVSQLWGRLLDWRSASLFRIDQRTGISWLKNSQRDANLLNSRSSAIQIAKRTSIGSICAILTTTLQRVYLSTRKVLIHIYYLRPSLFLFIRRLLLTFFRWLHVVWIPPTSVTLSWQTRMGLTWTVYNLIIEILVIIRCFLLFLWIPLDLVFITLPNPDMMRARNVSSTRQTCEYCIQSNCWCMTFVSDRNVGTDNWRLTVLGSAVVGKTALSAQVCWLSRLTFFYLTDWPFFYTVYFESFHW